MCSVSYCLSLLYSPSPHQSQSRLTRDLTQLNPYSYAIMVNPSLPATSCIHTNDFAAKTVVDIQPHLKVCKTHTKITNISPN